MDTLWQRNPSREQLRDFGLGVGGVLILVGGILFWRHPAWNAHWVAWATGALLGLMGATHPPLLKWLYQPWMAIAFVLGVVTTTVLLSATYLLIMPLFRLGARLTGNNSLDRGWLPGARSSYWKPHERIDVSDRHFRAF